MFLHKYYHKGCMIIKIVDLDRLSLYLGLDSNVLHKQLDVSLHQSDGSSEQKQLSSSSLSRITHDHQQQS